MPKYNVMDNLAHLVKMFKVSFKDVVNNNMLPSRIGNMNYVQYCIYNAMFCLIEMERSEQDFPTLPAKDQNQISFWIVQMRAEARKILKEDYAPWYKLVKQQR